jgi:predicted HD phosphohydrolase
MAAQDYFLAGGAMQARLRALLERETARRAPRFGVQRRDFLRGAMGALAASAVLEQLPRFRSIAEAQEGFEPPSDDCYAQVEAAHARFTSSDASSAPDWEIIHAAARAQQTAVPRTVMNMLGTMSTLYIGAGISRLMHNLQTATRAMRANASDETVLIGLIHDAGEVVSTTNHAEVAAALLRPYVSPASYYIVRTHMEFQLKHYGDEIFLPTDMRDRYVDQPWYAQAAVFSDALDQMAFDPDYDTLPLAEFEPLVQQFFGRVPAHAERTAEDCL